jgi:putative endonuclease
MKKVTPKRAAGDIFEQRACDALKRAGLSLLARNYLTRAGEIDLLMRDGETLVFVEVRYRRSKAFGGAAASITASKRTRLIRAAEFFILTHPQHSRRRCRFDVVGFDGPAEAAVMEWCKGAFDVF